MSPFLPATATATTPATRHAIPTEANLRALVYAFYDKVRADSLLGPVFEETLHGNWDAHLPKMCAFWSSLVLGTKEYRGNVQQVHQPLPGLEPKHFSHWLFLFLTTVETHYEPAAAVQFMEPALRIAHSLQLSRFGWDYVLPAEQKALLERIAPPRRRVRVIGEPRGEPRNEPGNEPRETSASTAAPSPAGTNGTRET
ncbi:group III truncated hemoglobin [Paraburkholderia bonniea]|uniref:group III truncated hemoglobin n=1 Tax=Paraburkholderia bonniea TaxID=2152891 RepID=UPI001FE39D50|nr:group III truncated hemoglobin [Paraburkholderia bonniea]